MQKQVTFKVQGMQRDLSVSSFNPQYAYENKNIRIMSTDDNTLLSIVNEKGTLPVYINGIGDNLEGTPIGQSLLNDELIVFTTGGTIEGSIPDITIESFTIDDIDFQEINIDINSDLNDKIYKLWLEGLSVKGELLYSGKLNFNYNYPIETISIYENEKSKKVYWVDGLNQPRVINIASINKLNDNSFDFVRNIESNSKVTISCYNGNGQFPSGVIQYCFTYVNRYLQESNIFYTSGLYYTSLNNRGGSPEELSNSEFRITISDLDKSWDYVRIYSIMRTSINSEVTVKRVIDLNIDLAENNTLTYTDSGNYGDIVDSTSLLYVGGIRAIFDTISHKDGTLFLGGIKTFDTDTKLEDFKINTSSLTNSTRPINTLPTLEGVYSYKNTLSSPTERIFKYGETYRIGIQFQDNTGKWSNPLFIDDVINNIKPYIGRGINEGEDTNKQYVGNFFIVFNNNDSIVKYLKSNKYIKARPLVVYPKFNERTIVSQGVICPTVFRASDRYSNSPYAQSSWLFRPFSLTNINKTSYDRGYTTSYNKNGYFAEFRHNAYLPTVNYRQCEVQNAYSITVPGPLISSNQQSWIQDYGDLYYVDHSIFTFHSPDVDLGDEFTMSGLDNYKVKVVGIIPISTKYVTRTLSTSSPPFIYSIDNNNYAGFGKYIEDQKIALNSSNEDISQAWYSIGADTLWMDYAVKDGKVVARDDKYYWGYLTYLWHRNASLNNDGGATARLDSKTESILRYSYDTYYLDSPITIESKNDYPDISVWNSNELSVVYVGNKAYYGNIDAIASPVKGNQDNASYPVIVTGVSSDSGIPKEIYKGYAQRPNYSNPGSGAEGRVMDYELTSPVSIKYKSTKHLVVNLGDTITNSNNQSNYTQWILPQIKVNNQVVNFLYNETESNTPFWTNISSGNTIFNYNTVNIDSSINNYFKPGYDYTLGGGVLYLCDIVRDNIDKDLLFGGTSKEALLNNEWYIAGESVNIPQQDEEGFIVYWNWGDTYYQRYDCLKTYPYDSDSQNNVIDVLSFMCETRVNIDGRYDKNRGIDNLLNISPTNFNLINKVYSQQDNYFTYRVTDSSTEVTNFPNVITWTKTKNNGELTDTWTNITLASTLDLDGDKGRLRALRRFNNELIAFQDRGISNILYNSRTTISSTDGVPIELANSGKVDGKRYISDKIGCQNKWSIKETPNGIYFIDDISKGIYLFNGNLVNISDKLGFHSWINKKSTGVNMWDPVNFKGFITYYDKVNGDIFFISNEECLAYSEPLGQFSSFYSYEKSPIFANVGDKGIFIRQSNNGGKYKVWLHNEGKYNSYFDTYSPFYITVIANEYPSEDKIFTNIEFRSDSWKDNKLLNSTFDTLEVWNEYQKGITSLYKVISRPSSLRDRFRIWRANIPRDCSNHRDRIRNPWIYLKLSRDIENYNKTILHDLTVKYFY